MQYHVKCASQVLIFGRDNDINLNIDCVVVWVTIYNFCATQCLAKTKCLPGFKLIASIINGEWNKKHWV